MNEITDMEVYVQGGPPSCIWMSEWSRIGILRDVADHVMSPRAWQSGMLRGFRTIREYMAREAFPSGHYYEAFAGYHVESRIRFHYDTTMYCCELYVRDPLSAKGWPNSWTRYVLISTSHPNGSTRG